MKYILVNKKKDDRIIEHLLRKYMCYIMFSFIKWILYNGIITDHVYVFTLFQCQNRDNILEIQFL